MELILDDVTLDARRAPRARRGVGARLRRAASPRSSAPTARARPRWCAPPRGWSRRRRARSGSTSSDVAAIDPRRARARDRLSAAGSATVHWNMIARDVVALGPPAAPSPSPADDDAAIARALAATDTAALRRPPRRRTVGRRARARAARARAGGRAAMAARRRAARQPRPGAPARPARPAARRRAGRGGGGRSCSTTSRRRRVSPTMLS